MRRKPMGFVVAATVVGLLGVGGVAVAGIPSGGVINGCYNKSGALRVVDSTTACAKGEVPLTWNQSGPTGPVGATGAAGAPGAVGPEGPVGPTGLMGGAGITGAQGPIGPAGPPGPGATQFGSDTQSAIAGMGSGCTVGEAILNAGYIANGVPANGQLLPVAEYPSLFTLIGTTYGGNGITTFALPNLGSAAPNGLTYSICVVGTFPNQFNFPGLP